MSKTALPPSDQEMSLVQHLLELRNAVAKSVIAVLVLFLILFPFANDIYTYIADPLTRFMPEGNSMIAVGVASPFLTPFKLSLVLAIYIAMPILFYQLWRFIAPALYTHERQLVAPVLFFSSFLFYAGGAFSYYVVFPLVFGFLSQTAPEGVTIATDISLYLDFVIKMFFAFGMAFEVPVITVLLILTGMVKPRAMSHARPYVIVGAFVLGMLLTPPDVISQTLLAVPVWLLYELGIVVGTFILKRKGIDPNGDSDDNEPKPMSEPEPSSASYNKKSDDEGFDNRYAEQNKDINPHQIKAAQQAAEKKAEAAKSQQTPVDDDFDFDAEFDKIDAEMEKLKKDAEQREQQKNANNATSDSTSTAQNPSNPEVEQKPDDKPKN